MTAHEPIGTITYGEDWQAGASYGTGRAMDGAAMRAIISPAPAAFRAPMLERNMIETVSAKESHDEESDTEF
jgi:hypothetical protein